MFKSVKKLIINKLSSYFELKRKNIVNAENPLGIDFGEKSFIESPKMLTGCSNIKIGDFSSIGHSAWISALDSYLDQNFSPQIIIGNNVRIGNYACITGINEIIIEDGCLISEYFYASDHFHGYDPLTGLSPKDQPLFSKGKIIIGKNSFLGYRVSVLPSVSIGQNCVVGAHSVVTKTFPDYCMIAGVPARIIKTFNFELNQWCDVNDK